MEGDIAFHHGLFVASGLTLLLAFGDLLAIFFRRFRESVKKGSWSNGVEQHQTIIDHLRAGRPEAAEPILCQHLDFHHQFYGDHV